MVYVQLARTIQSELREREREGREKEYMIKRGRDANFTTYLD